ncbi:MAG TPA: site-specific integrase [Polyangia bacterium]|jgi:integrase
MGRTNTSGQRGLSKLKSGQWKLDLRWREPGTGEWRRLYKMWPAGTTKATVKAAAKKEADAALAGGYEPKKEEAKKLGAALDSYLEWAETNRPRSYDSRVSIAKCLKEKFGDVVLDEISAFSVDRFKKVRTDEKVSPASINRAVAMMKHACGLFVSWGWMMKTTADAIRGVRLMKEPPGRVRYLTPAEEERLFSELGDTRQSTPRERGTGPRTARRASVRRVVAAVLLSGLRMGEIVGLRKAQVDLQGRVLNLTVTKNNRVRRVPINDQLLEVLTEALAASPEGQGAVFTNSRGTPITKAGVHAVFYRAVKRAGLDDRFTFHDLRHCFATAVRRQGSGLDVIAELLGHSTLTMAKRYAHLGDQQMAAAVASLPALRKPAPIAAPLPLPTAGEAGKGA